MKIGLPYFEYILHIVDLFGFLWWLKIRCSYYLLFLTFVIPFEWHICFVHCYLAITHRADVFEGTYSLIKCWRIKSSRRSLISQILPGSCFFILTNHTSKINRRAPQLVRPDAREFFPSWKLLFVKLQFFLFAICFIFSFCKTKTDFGLIELL